MLIRPERLNIPITLAAVKLAQPEEWRVDNYALGVKGAKFDRSSLVALYSYPDLGEEEVITESIEDNDDTRFNLFKYCLSLQISPNWGVSNEVSNPPTHLYQSSLSRDGLPIVLLQVGSTRSPFSEGTLLHTAKGLSPFNALERIKDVIAFSIMAEFGQSPGWNS